MNNLKQKLSTCQKKPAKLFTRVECVGGKTVYCHCRNVWEKVSELVRAGYTAQAAIDRIYEGYGREKSVTDIFNQMRNDRCTGGHSSLCE